MPSDSRSSGVGSGFRNPLITSADIPDGSITTTKLANLAVTTAKIANAAITTAKIDDAAITTAKIANLAVDTAKIANASITTAKIADLAVTNAKIASLSASKITAGTISATTITMGSGGLIQLSDGEIRTSTGTTYISLSGAGVADRLRFVRGGSVVAYIHNVTSGDLEIGANRDISILPSRHLNLIAEGNLVLSSVSGSVSTPGVFNVGSWIVVGQGSLSNPAIRFSGATSTGIWKEQDANFDGDGIAFRDANGRIATLTRVGNVSRLYWAESNDRLEYDSDNEQFVIVVQGGSEFVLGTGGVLIPNVFNTTTGSAANVNVASGGTLARSTSSARYKTDIRRWDRRASVLDLTPSLFRSTIERDGDELRLGLIAEDVAERFPLAAIYDDAGRPDAIDWNAIVAGLIAEVQTLRASIANLDPS